MSGLQTRQKVIYMLFFIEFHAIHTILLYKSTIVYISQVCGKLTAMER